MTQDSEHRRRQEAFHSSIRREALDKLFVKERMQLMEQILVKEQQELSKQLDNFEKRQFWLKQRAIELVGQPNPYWGKTLKILSKAINNYEKQYDAWMKQGIIHALILLFKQQYKHLKLSALSAKILYNILYRTEGQLFLQQIMQYQFTIDVVQLGFDSEATFSQLIQYMILLGKLAQQDHVYRQKIVKDGGAQLLVTLGQRKTNHIDYLDVYFWFMNSLLKVFDNKNGSRSFPSQNVILVFLPIIENNIAIQRPKKVILGMLKCLDSISSSNRQTIISHILACENIKKAILLNLQQQDRLIQISCLRILTFCTSSANIKYTKQLVALGLLDGLALCQKVSTGNDHEDRIHFLMLNCLLNVVGNTPQQCKLLLQSPLIQFVLRYAHINQPIKMIRDAVYLLSTIVRAQNYNMCDLLIKKYKILDIMMSILNWSKDHQSEITGQILQTIIVLANCSNTVYIYGKDKKILDILMDIYNFESLLNQLSEHKNKLVASLADRIIDLAYNP